MGKLPRAFILLFLISGLIVFKINNFLKPTDILYEGKIIDLDVDDTVEVYFDDYGVPSVFASNDSDMFKVAGYIGARDRLFQMSFMKYAYKGHLSLVLNDSLIVEDTFLRTLGFEKIAKKTLAKVPPSTLQHLQDTCFGINAYVQNLSPEDYPLEFKLIGVEKLPIFEPLDIVALSTMMAWELQGGWDSELFFGAINEQLGSEYLNEILPSYNDSFITIASNDVLLKSYKDFASNTKKIREILKTDRDGYGSNAWVVSGTKTDTGFPLLANDPHLSYGQPPWWYEIRLKSDNYNFGGYGLYGFPLPVIGHNDHIGWGFTNVMTDDMDFYIETLNEDKTKYMFDGEWKDLKIEQEVVSLKSGDKRTITIRSTHRGPIVSDIHPDAKGQSKAISFKWTEFDAFDETTALFMLAKATNWDEFSEASKLFGAPGQNWTYADKNGNIGWRPNSKIPIRLGAEKLIPFDGSTSKHDWTGYVPFDEMPYVYNPEKGYISNGNNKTIDDDYPYYISRYWADPSRGEQIDRRLKVNSKLGVEDMKSILNEITSPFAQEYSTLFNKNYTQGFTDKGDIMYNILNGWDGVESIDSDATVVFHAIYIQLIQNLFQDELQSFGDDSFETFYSLKYIRSLAIRSIFDGEATLWVDNVLTSKKETLNDIVNQSFDNAHDFLTKNYGNPKELTWGDVHQVTYRHRLNGDPLVKRFINFSTGPFPMAGSGMTPRAASYSVSDPFDVRAGSSMRRVIDFSDFDNGFSILPTGQSGVFKSPHYTDQTLLYNKGEFKSFKFSESVIKDDTKMRKLIFVK
ncbi:MAG: penicillin acylase family protein [Candidatus Marinimicrobia bacterium]|jgi:penicillin amidase|nr:penicillin acylase family protein [Candidatus Neomarinimicrobiota bacterium]MDG1268626.1 penicillin acylase family protein [Candidatus Neomarinimicrobiota bacterium]MDG2188752.1 penicillin acylase family protein [Candidatus Neomarinimicrobiota bacterium]